MSDVKSAVERVLPSVRTDLERLVRIPSVSADPEASDQVRESADRVAELARDAGAAAVDILSVADGAPAVVAHWPAPEGTPTVLLYAHHDVQPTGPVDEWTSDPFEPTERDGRLYGRGAADDKAGLAAHIAALRAFDGEPPVGVVLFVEGEEEIGSPTFTRFLETYQDKLAADVIVVADSMNLSIETPAVTTSLRGLVDCFVEVSVLERAVHSGLAGGPVLDALTALCRLLAKLHDENGDVAVPALVSDELFSVELDETRYREESGILDGVELSGTSSLANRLWAKPAISVLGIDAPVVADASNILVHKARAKVSMRIAPEQDHHKAMDALSKFLEANAEYGAQVAVSPNSMGGGCRLDDTTPAYAAADSAFEEAFGVTPTRIGMGGSIPFIADFQRLFPDASVLVTGVEDPDSRAHGIDESLHLGQFSQVCLAEALFLQRLASV